MDQVPSSGLKLEVEGRLEAVLLQAAMEQVREEEFAKEDGWINGLEGWEVRVGEGPVVVEEEGGMVRLDLSLLQPGGIVVLAVTPGEEQEAALAGLGARDGAALTAATAPLTLLDVQFVLFQCDQEGREAGWGAYEVPGHGALNYCGLAGVAAVLDTMRPSSDLGHPLAVNLRAGDWLLDYTLARLAASPATALLAAWLDEAFRHLRRLPRFLIPTYFDSIVMEVWAAVHRHTLSLLSPFVSGGSDFIQRLALGGVIHTAAVPSAPLPPLSPLLQPPPLLPSPTLAAGLPHFSTGYMRSWGRDTFISLRGALLIPGRLVEARDIILGYAATLRHGLIPNLLDGGKAARFNCRDAVWWWLRAVLDYCDISGDHGVMAAPVLRLWPQDNAENGPTVEQALADVIQEALDTHLHGLAFRERNAGRTIDEHMRDEGFNNRIGVDPATGFVFGGNVWNCGTWMDKMGSSSESGNKGVPSSPRDGSAVELVGLSYSCLRDLASLPSYPHKTLATTFSSLTAWADTIQANFDRHFWVGGEEGAEVEPHPHLVNCTSMYKDSVGSGGQYTDYQLRPNAAIALAVAPDLACPRRAWAALEVMAARLLGPLGLATLDPADWAYRGDYHNSEQGGDPATAHGANYHQGPEWLWPVGFYCRALLATARRLGEEEREVAAEQVGRILARHQAHLTSSPWLGLPELTNRKGAVCEDSNPIQAWSMACLLDAVYDLHHT